MDACDGKHGPHTPCDDDGCWRWRYCACGVNLIRDVPLCAGCDRQSLGLLWRRKYGYDVWDALQKQKAPPPASADDGAANGRTDGDEG